MDDDRPVLDQVNLVAEDMERSLEFYGRMGLEIPDVPPPWHAHHRSVTMPAGLHMDLDSQRFAPHWCRDFARARSPAVIGFRVRKRETVDRIYRELNAAGHRGLQPPYDTFWGARYAVVEDPDGNAIGLMSESDATRRSAPPDPQTFG
jgi:uncharacterized glyoxalase superfamily protein PhnB